MQTVTGKVGRKAHYQVLSHQKPMLRLGLGGGFEGGDALQRE
jgi:hypothetical protein